MKDPDLTPVHPGEVLKEDFLVPMGISEYRLAKDIHVQQTRVSAIVNGKRSVSTDTALRLARYFGTTPDLWLNLQQRFELLTTEKELQPELATITPR